MDLDPVSQSAISELKTCPNLSHVQRHVPQFERKIRWNVFAKVPWHPVETFPLDRIAVGCFSQLSNQLCFRWSEPIVRPSSYSAHVLPLKTKHFGRRTVRLQPPPPLYASTSGIRPPENSLALFTRDTFIFAAAASGAVVYLSKRTSRRHDWRLTTMTGLNMYRLISVAGQGNKGLPPHILNWALSTKRLRSQGHQKSSANL